MKVFLMVLLFLPSLVFAQTASPQDINSTLNDFADPTGIEQVGLTEAAGNAVEAAYGVMGLIFFVLAIYAGITWMTAQGKEDQITKARNILVGATIGLVIVIGAFGITTFISERAIGDLSTGGSTQEIETGVIDSKGSGAVQKPSCCIIRTNRPPMRRYRSEPAGALNVCYDSMIEQSALSGSDTDSGVDWEFYPDIEFGEQCTLLKSCWEMRNEDNREECINNITSAK